MSEILTPLTLKPVDQKAIENIRRAMTEGKVDAGDALDTYTAKSNWERYFEERIPVYGLNEKWTKLYAYRNQVAHAKRMKRSEYGEASSLADELTVAFESCLERIGEIRMTEEESEAAQEVARETVSPIRTVIRDVDTGRVISSSPSVYTVGTQLLPPDPGLTAIVAGLRASSPQTILSQMPESDSRSIYASDPEAQPPLAGFPMYTTIEPSDSG